MVKTIASFSTRKTHKMQGLPGTKNQPHRHPRECFGSMQTAIERRVWCTPENRANTNLKAHPQKSQQQVSTPRSKTIQTSRSTSSKREQLSSCSTKNNWEKHETNAWLRVLCPIEPLAINKAVPTSAFPHWSWVSKAPAFWDRQLPKRARPNNSTENPHPVCIQDLPEAAQMQ